MKVTSFCNVDLLPLTLVNGLIQMISYSLGFSPTPNLSIKKAYLKATSFK
jgi:hypothetical protein